MTKFEQAAFKLAHPELVAYLMQWFDGNPKTHPAKPAYDRINAAGFKLPTAKGQWDQQLEVVRFCREHGVD